MIELPEWERKKDKEAKVGKTAETKKMGFKKIHGLGLVKNLHLQVRTLGHFAF